LMDTAAEFGRGPGSAVVVARLGAQARCVRLARPDAFGTRSRVDPLPIRRLLPLRARSCHISLRGAL
jgi:hypothetical protein